MRALEAPDIRERLTALDVEPWPGTLSSLANLLRADIERYATIMQRGLAAATNRRALITT